MAAIPDEVEQPARGVPSVIRCGLLIAGVKIALQIVGWGATWHWIRRRAEQVALGDEDAADVISRTEHAVAMAGALYPGRALCLEQSLVLYYLLRRRGIPVAFHLGIQPHPFAAHAWVEHRGEAINDIAEHVKDFTPLPDTAA